MIERYSRKEIVKIELNINIFFFCKRNNINKIFRYWKSESYKKNLINKGWMPPYTTLFINKKIYKKLKYSTKYSIWP